MKITRKPTKRIPPEAAKEMDRILRSGSVIPRDELEKVLIEYNVQGDPDKLISRDRKSRVQRFTAKYRDEDGCRDVLTHFNKEHQRSDCIVIEKCMSIATLDEITDALSKTITGYRASVKKAARRRDRLLLLECGYEIRPRPPRRTKPAAIPRIPEKQD